MTEAEAIAALDRVLAALAAAGATVDRRFFDAGEWLLAFEDILWHLAQDRVPVSAVEPDYSALLDYFADWLDDWHRQMHDDIVGMTRD